MTIKQKWKQCHTNSSPYFLVSYLAFSFFCKPYFSICCFASYLLKEDSSSDFILMYHSVLQHVQWAFKNTLSELQVIDQWVIDRFQSWNACGRYFTLKEPLSSSAAIEKHYVCLHWLPRNSLFSRSCNLIIVRKCDSANCPPSPYTYSIW